MTSRSDGAERAWRAREAGRWGIFLAVMMAEDLSRHALRSSPAGAWDLTVFPAVVLAVSLVVVVRGFQAGDNVERKPHPAPRIMLMVFGGLWSLGAITDATHALVTESLVTGFFATCAWLSAALMRRQARTADVVSQR